MTTNVDERFDLIVLGAGPAGLTAALYAARARRSVLVLDTGTPGGQMVLTHAVANYPGVEQTSGRELSQTMLSQAEAFGATVKKFARISTVDFSGEPKTVTLRNGTTYAAPTVIVATGGVPRKLGVEGEDRFFGQGISYCATCDGEFFTDRPIAVVGGGNSALEEAVALSEYASEVTVIHEFDQFQAEPWLVAEAQKNPKIKFLMNQRVTGFGGEPGLEYVEAAPKAGEDGQALTAEQVSAEQVPAEQVPVDGTFIFIGYVPNTQFLDGALEVNDRQEVLTDNLMATSVPGVFAAGDVREKRDRQITTAVADGTVAALSALAFLTD